MGYEYVKQGVLSSILCFQKDADSFFSPVTLGHTGFAADGFYYASGVREASRQSSWFTEPQGITRGALPAFPQQALVLVGRASFSILDATSQELNLWMLFYLCDGRAYSNNQAGGPNGYLPASVSWTNGQLSILFAPDPGSFAQAPVVTTFDFASDRVYTDTRS